MTELILVDTSVLIPYLKGDENERVDRFSYILDASIPFGINSFVYQEVLQGVRNEKEFRMVQEYLGSQRFYRLRDEKRSYEEAAMLYYKCKKRGITIGSTIDCLIAQTALENNIFLLHNDKDFDLMAQVAPLKFFK